MLIDITGERGYQVDWDLVKTVIAESNGIPVEIGMVIAEDPEGPEKQEIVSAQ